jgi:hypothetical protein
MRGQKVEKWGVYNECIDSTVSHIHVCFVVLMWTLTITMQKRRNQLEDIDLEGELEDLDIED